jgi:uncharacterized membrane protein (DUF2068 family)
MKKRDGILRLIITYKTVVGICEVLLSAGLIHVFGKNLGPIIAKVAVAFRMDITNPIVAGAIKHASALQPSTYIGITMVLFSFGALNIVEAWGLHLRQRWAEWLTVIATSLLIPFEVKEVVKGVTALKVAVLVINIAIVIYLARHKELFHRRRASAARH